MKASLRSNRTVSVDDSSPAFPDSDGVAPQSDAQDRLTASEGRASRPSDLPAELNALRSARTPLIEGVDYRSRTPVPVDARLERTSIESPPQEKPHVDTLSPLDSVPPPAPYLADAPRARPSVVPPVRSPYLESSSPARPDPYFGRLGSDPPARIPLSDRPSRPAFRSDFPMRNAHSEPPPSSNRAPLHHRRSWPDELDHDSPEAQRRQAVTLPADARLPSRIPDYDPSLPLPPLRAPSFPADHLSATIRRHENSRLRNVAMTMMFVICIVTGAIAGMRWYVERADEFSGAGDAPASLSPRAAKLKLDRPPPNAVVTRRGGEPAVAGAEPPVAAESLPTAPRDPGPLASSAKPSSQDDPPAAVPPDPVGVRSPWDPPRMPGPLAPEERPKTNPSAPVGNSLKIPPRSTRSPTRPALKPMDPIPEPPLTLD